MTNEIMMQVAGEIAAVVSKTYRRKVWWLNNSPDGRQEGISSEEDLIQEAMLAMIKAVPNYDPAFGSTPRAYLFTVAKRTISSMVWRASSPVSTSQTTMLPELQGLIRAPLQEANDKPNEDNPEALLARDEWLEQACAAVRARIHEASPDGLAEAVLLGEKKPREVAIEYAVPVQKVYSATARARARVGSDLNLWRMWREE